MKKIFALAALLLSFGAVVAQDNYTRLQVSYVFNKMTNSEIGDKYITPKGLTLGGVMGFLVTDDYPVYVEPGVTVSWAHSAVDYKAAGLKLGENKFTYMNLAIPINAVYKYEINDMVALSAHAGLNMKLNYLAKQHLNPEIGEKQSFSWLSKKDMGSRDDRASIFQLGGQIGVGFHVQDLYIGYQFQTDFVPFQKTDGADPHRWLTNYITIGYTL